MSQPADLPGIDFLLLQLKLKRIWQQRSLGQHFLTDVEILERIADAAGLDSGTLALEIGPGPGTLTTLLAARGGGVLAVELDERLRPMHQAAFGQAPQVQFAYGDALRLDLDALARARAAELDLPRMVLTGNLPFQITSPLLFAQCGPHSPWVRLCVMIQKEVADRIASPPGRRDYGILTVKLAYWWKVTQRFDVEAAMFFPRPKVDASVLVLERLPVEAHPPLEEWPALSEFIDGAFGQKRKMLINSLAARWRAWPGREPALEALQSEGIDPHVRAEALTPEQLARLCRRLTAAAPLIGP